MTQQHHPLQKLIRGNPRHPTKEHGAQSLIIDKNYRVLEKRIENVKKMKKEAAIKRTLRRRRNYREKEKNSILSPNSYATKVDQLIESATPSKEVELVKRNLGKRKERILKDTICQGVSDLYSKTNNSSHTSTAIREKLDSTISSKIRKKRLGWFASKILNRSRGSFAKYSVIQRGRPSIKQSTKSLVITFYNDIKISRERPEKRFVGKRLMILPSLQADKKFKVDHGNIIGFKNFSFTMTEECYPF